MVELSLCKGQSRFWEPKFFKMNILLPVKQSQSPKDRKKNLFRSPLLVSPTKLLMLMILNGLMETNLQVWEGQGEDAASVTS